MCICPRVALKLVSLLLMLILMIFCATDMAISYENIEKSESKVTLLLILSISVSLFLSVALLFGFYAGFRNKYVLLQVLVFVLVAFSLSKLILWIIAGNLVQQLNATGLVIHMWFQLSIVTSMVLIVFVTLYCLRLQDDV
ncbi:uncharacterized protein LOC111519778 isoform X1 [Drosophila willistoni]|uniref:uncharacterized protein LOC111519778 isoform X1 n=1 Tax=Drosophila willistoni TaxID=7260 RepID=UPI000C26C1DC|nr:uncharacterized protein LOC111519778 isoform X1 [Drosophila willistoni]